MNLFFLGLDVKHLLIDVLIFNLMYSHLANVTLQSLVLVIWIIYKHTYIEREREQMHSCKHISHLLLVWMHLFIIHQKRIQINFKSLGNQSNITLVCLFPVLSLRLYNNHSIIIFRLFIIFYGNWSSKMSHCLGLGSLQVW